METEMESRIADPFSWDGHEAETLLVCESGSGRAKELVAVVIVKTEGRPEAFYRVREAGEKDVDFESWLEAVDYYNCIGVENHPATPDTGIAKTELQDEDWKRKNIQTSAGARRSGRRRRSFTVENNWLRRRVLEKKNPSRPHICWGSLFCTNLTQPTGNLDSVTAGEIINILKTLAKERNKCVIVVTHSKEAADSADIILELSGKKLKKVNKMNLEVE